MKKTHFTLTVVFLFHLAGGVSSSDTANPSHPNSAILNDVNEPSDSCINRKMIPIVHVLSILAIIGHSVVTTVVLRQHVKFTLDNNEIYLILGSLSASDILVSVFMSFASILASRMDSIDNNCRTLRTVASYFVFSMHLVSIKTVCLLAIDRYIGFIFCFQYNNIMNKKNIIRTLSLIWFSSLSINAFAMLDKNILPYSSFIELRHSTCIIFATAVFFGAIFLFAIHAHLYLVAKAQLNQEENQQIAVFGRNAELRDLRWRRMKMTVVSLATTISYLVTYIPISVVILLLLQSDKYLFVQSVSGPLSYLNPAIDPIICVATMRKLRQHVKKDCKKFWNWSKQMLGGKRKPIRRAELNQITPTSSN